jgi:hypothetical protein
MQSGGIGPGYCFSSKAVVLNYFCSPVAWSVGGTWSVAWDATYFNKAPFKRESAFFARGPAFFAASTPIPTPRITPRIPESAPFISWETIR